MSAVKRRGTRSRWRWLIPAYVGLALTGTACRVSPRISEPARARTEQVRSFAADSPWNTPIGATPALDVRSDAIVAGLNATAHPAIAGLYELGVPVFTASAASLRYQVRCLQPWGHCALADGPVPIPGDAEPNATADRPMVIIDAIAARVYEFWQARKNGGSWTAGWGGVVSLSGSGTPGDAVGAGVSRLAGLVRLTEIARGDIPHALVFSSSLTCAGSYRYPATKSDGRTSGADCLPMGARIQLDPAVDLDNEPGLTQGERIIGRALRLYGAYAVDTGAAPLSFTFETPTGGGDPYPNLGLTWDAYDLHLPWLRLRVLAAP
jgi:hypothetical protein